jgi:hypothetical protein
VKSFEELVNLSINDLQRECVCEDEVMCEACQIIGALDAGIPRSVIAGKTKLSDHFSEGYIDHKCGRSRKEFK